MGHQINRKRRPRRGSLQYWPRKRSRRTHARVRNYGNANDAKPLLFAGYKAGMTHIIVKDTRKGSKTIGQEISMPVTVIECPPLKIFGFRLYSTSYPSRVVSEFVAKDDDKNLKKRLKIRKKSGDIEKFIKENEGKYDDIRLLVYTQPKMIGFKKKPEIVEVGIGGNLAEKLNYAKENFGKEVKVSDIFAEKEYADVLSITKGKGFQGAVKRFGVKLLQNKAEKNRRKAGSLGPWHPAKVSYRVPQHGQLGNFARVEFNKQVVKIGNGEERVTPDGGFLHYGNVKNDYVILKGSVPGPVKRLVKMRKPFRPAASQKEYELIQVSFGSKQ